jgi:hypothetical protein
MTTRWSHLSLWIIDHDLINRRVIHPSNLHCPRWNQRSEDPPPTAEQSGSAHQRGGGAIAGVDAPTCWCPNTVADKPSGEDHESGGGILTWNYGGGCTTHSMRRHTTEELLRWAILRSPSINSTPMKLWTDAESSSDTPRLVLEIPFDNATRAAAFSALPPCDDGAQRRKLASRWGLPRLGQARLPSDEWRGWGYVMPGAVYIYIRDSR